MEIWQPVPEFNGLYEVSDLGRVRNSRNGYVKKPTWSKTEQRFCLVLWKENRCKLFKVHRIVLTAFRGPCPEGQEGCHNSGDTRDNRLDNLRWDTHTSNIADRALHGTSNRGERCGTAKLTLEQVRLIRADTRMQKHIAADFGVRQSAISRIKTGDRWAHDH